MIDRPVYIPHTQMCNVDYGWLRIGCPRIWPFYFLSADARVGDNLKILGIRSWTIRALLSTPIHCSSYSPGTDGSGWHYFLIADARVGDNPEPSVLYVTV